MWSSPNKQFDSTTSCVRRTELGRSFTQLANRGVSYDSEGNMVMIENPMPTRIFRIEDFGKKDDHKMEFLGWGEG
jgi:hypothetical protein